MKTSGMTRALYDCPVVPLTTAGPEVRLVVSLLMAPCPLLALRRRRAGRGSLRALCQHSHPSVYRLGCAGSVPPSRLVRKPCWPMKTMNRNLTAGTEHYPLRPGVCSNLGEVGCGTSAWNWGRRSLPSSLCTTAFASAYVAEPVHADEPAELAENMTQSSSIPAAVYGSPQWTRSSFTHGFPGSAFTSQP